MFDSIKKTIVGALLVSGLALGQSPTPPSDVNASKVPDAEKADKSHEALVRMRGAFKDVLGKLSEARLSKDVVKLNCVNEKVTQIKGLLRISEQADVALQEAIAKKETTNSEHQYTKVVIARTKVDQMRLEAEQCMGSLAFRADENLSVEVEEPRDLPKGDPTIFKLPPPVIMQLPPASPTT